MQRYLLFDSGCSTCTGIARQVEEESGGWISARSLRDPDMQCLLKQADPNWRWTPTLLEVDGDRIRRYVGVGLQLTLARQFGIRRSVRLLKLVTQALGNSSAGSRRQLLKGGLFVAGLALTAPLAPKPAQARRAQPRQEPDRPGEVPQREGVTAYTVIERQENGNKIIIHFAHQDPSLSGVVEASGRKDRRMTLRLKRDDEVLALTLHRYEPEVEVKARGQQRVRFTLVDGKWEPDRPDGMSIVTNNATSIALLSSIYSEFEIPPDPEEMAAALAIPANASLRTCTCSSGNQWVRGLGSSTFRSLACENATADMNRRCTNNWCIGCCNRLNCDCVCLIADYTCSCGRIGYFCTSCA